MKKRTFQIPESEIEIFLMLIGQGYALTINEKASPEEIEEDGWRGIWGSDDEDDIFCSKDKSKKEVREFLSRPFEAEDPKIFFHRGNTHCGMLDYLVGWVHEAGTTQEQLDEAVVLMKK